MCIFSGCREKNLLIFHYRSNEPCFFFCIMIITIVIITCLFQKKRKGSTRGVVYLGHIPPGFYEPQMKKFFGQFGRVTRLRLSRSKKVQYYPWSFWQFGVGDSVGCRGCWGGWGWWVGMGENNTAAVLLLFHFRAAWAHDSLTLKIPCLKFPYGTVHLHFHWIFLLKLAPSWVHLRL